MRAGPEHPAYSLSHSGRFVVGADQVDGRVAGTLQ
jgi:hypothetical protein